MTTQTVPHLYDAVIPVAWFVGSGLLFSGSERWFPVRRRSARSQRALDTVGLSIAWLTSALGIDLATRFLGVLASDPIGAANLPDWLRTLSYIVLSDASRYLTHRLMHTRFLWPAHRFHHSITFLDWFAGNRASIPHVLLFMVPMAVWARLLQVTPNGVLLNVCLMISWNHFMHANVRLSPGLQRFCEWFVTTPRYHLIHHSDDPRFEVANLGSIFTIWDRLFGTFVSPDGFDPAALTFGTPPVTLWRWLIGI